METIIEIFKVIASPLIVGVVLAFWNHSQNKKYSAEAEREKNAVAKDVVVLDLLVASAQLSYAVAMAVKRGTPNGEMEEAIKQYNKAMGRFRKFEREELARYMVE